MKAKKFVVALLTTALVLALTVTASAVASPEAGLLTWLLGITLLACARASGHTVWSVPKPIKVPPQSVVKQKVQILGSNCYIGYPSQGSHESQLTTYCLA
jgi:hypothetical protein